MHLPKRFQLLVLCILAVSTIASADKEYEPNEISFAYEEFRQTVLKMPRSHEHHLTLLQLKKPKCDEVRKHTKNHEDKKETVTQKKASLQVCASSIKKVMDAVVGVHEAAEADQPIVAASFIQNITREIPHANRSELTENDVAAEGDQGVIDDLELAFSGFVSAVHIELFELAGTELKIAAKQAVDRVAKMSRLIDRSIVNYEQMSTSMEAIREMWEDYAQECAEKAQRKIDQAKAVQETMEQTSKIDADEGVKADQIDDKKVERKAKISMLSPVNLPESKEKAAAKDQNLAPIMDGNEDGQGATPVSEAAIQISNSEQKVKVEEKKEAITADAKLTTDFNRPHAKKKEKVILNPVVVRAKAKAKTDANPQGVINAPFEENLAEDD